MTELAKEILAAMLDDRDISAVDILAKGIGSTEFEVEFIMTQLRLAGAT